MSRKRMQLIFLTLALLLLSSLIMPPAVGAQGIVFPLEFCRRGAWSSEEDFMMTEGEAYDGSPYISDGDILSFDGQVCARNRDLLLPRFDVSQDLGLDALDILDVERRLVAFSTELDSPHGTFTAGDLLFTNGAVIPNAALMLAFQINWDIGLDGVHFVGEPAALEEFLKLTEALPREGWSGGRLQEELQRFQMDIWFTIEGTGPTGPDILRPILDGDVLSAATGTIVMSQAQLLDPPIPSGIPARGVDFGLDGLTGPRFPERSAIIYSTEILYRGEGGPFNDGDILTVGGTVLAHHEDFFLKFHPASDFIGVDALSMPFAQQVGPRITHLCDIPTIEFNGGTVPIGGPGTGLRESPLASPPATIDTYTEACGQAVPFQGYLTTNPGDPVGDVIKFRVAYREVSEAIPAVDGDPATSAVQTSWTVFKPKLVFNGFFFEWTCTDPVTLATDVNGWMDASDFMDAYYGEGIFLNPFIRCMNTELRLAVLSSHALPVGETDVNGNPTGFPRPGVQDREDHMVFWMEWEDSTGFHREQADHHVQLDNTLPIIAPYPDGLQVFLPDGTMVPACGETGPNADELQVWAQFDDRHYDHFSLLLRGGLPPAAASYGPHFFYDPDNGPPGLQNTDDTGTTPDATTVHLRNIFLTDLGPSFTELDDSCCFVLDIYVYDRVIRHSFNGVQVNNFTGTTWSNAFITFAAQP